ncbi:MAG: oligosaccharide flippase family protein, partial [Oscillospiraceae bacterium]
MEKNNSFIRASAVLVASSMAVKILSAAYRVPLTRMLGAYAMGKYSIVFNLFVPFFALSTAGITPAVSRLATQMKTHS